MTHVVRDGTLGQKLRELLLPGIGLTEARFQPSQVLPWHAHERASFCIVLEGSYTEAFKTGVHRLTRFDLTFKPDGAEHRDQYDAGGAQCLIMDLEPSWMRTVRDKGPALQTPWFFSSATYPNIGRRLYSEFAEPDDVSCIAIEAMCCDLIVLGARRSRPIRAQTPPWLSRVREKLHADCEQHLSLQALAELADVHPVHLAQVFRTAYACTIGDYVRNLRVTRAADALARTNRPLASIAMACGFYDQSHMNRVFKKHMRVTPAEFRRRCRSVDTPAPSDDAPPPV